MADDTEKYPPSIQKLFQPKLPLPYAKPSDYPPEKRRTAWISPISDVKSLVADYLANDLPKKESKLVKPEKTTHQEKLQRAALKRKVKKDSFDRQLRNWNDPELFEKHEREFMKDPYRTVFIARLEYSLTELEITQHFQKYGVIESIRVIRDREGKSRGYGFIVYEREADANTCVADTCRTGVLMKGRKILVDIERSRILRHWKPRRLGGGEGGRDYSKEGKAASVAASGRRTNIANNPNSQAQLYRSQSGFTQSSSSYQASHHHIPPALATANFSSESRNWSNPSSFVASGDGSGPVDSRYSLPQHDFRPSHQPQVSSYSSYQSPNAPAVYSRSPHTSVASNVPEPRTSIKNKYAKYATAAEKAKEPTVADKYAKYASLGNGASGQQTTTRSMRSIRRG
ncbi:uncharacterized protein LODBEIA_P24780 [Lodderomyces beijingensis]|uniref:RRM domain-containing protein n=1 Tax=Lodderomyces beijingensis TaxID=1775926 RepID=A0ABP0ZK56_9ASCO